MEALRSYEAERPDQCELILSEDQFYGFSKGANRLAKHVQWVYVPAVKDPTSEQVEARNSALGKLLARTVRSKTNFDETVNALRGDMQGQYQALLDENQHVLDNISTALQTRLSEWAHARQRRQGYGWSAGSPPGSPHPSRASAASHHARRTPRARDASPSSVTKGALCAAQLRYQCSDSST